MGRVSLSVQRDVVCEVRHPRHCHDSLSPAHHADKDMNGTTTVDSQNVHKRDWPRASAVVHLNHSDLYIIPSTTIRLQAGLEASHIQKRIVHTHQLTINNAKKHHAVSTDRVQPRRARHTVCKSQQPIQWHHDGFSEGHSIFPRRPLLLPGVVSSTRRLGFKHSLPQRTLRPKRSTKTSRGSPFHNFLPQRFANL